MGNKLWVRSDQDPSRLSSGSHWLHGRAPPEPLTKRSITCLYFRRVTIQDDPIGEFRTTYSFEEIADSFEQHITRDEPLEVLIRGHLWIEAALTTLVDRTLRRPAALEKAGLSFSQRVSLAEAMGLVPQDMAYAMRQINRLRNRAAHNLNDPPRETDQAQLLGSCSPRLRYIAGADVKEYGFPAGLAVVISTLVVMTHRRIDDIDANSRYSSHLHQEVQEVLAKGTNGRRD